MVKKDEICIPFAIKMELNHQQKWQRCLDKIRDNIGVQKFDTWFSRIKLEDYREAGGKKQLTLFVPSNSYYELLEGKSGLPGIGTSLCHLLRQTLKCEFGQGVSLSYSIPTVAGDKDSIVKVTVPTPSPILTNPLGNKLKTAALGKGSANVSYEDFDPQLNSTYSFDNYCVGESNKLPYTIAKFIATHPDKTDFNPFFLYGGVGVGKTHLIQAIGISLKEQMPTARVLYTTMRLFEHLYVKAVLAKEVPDFLNWFQTIDVLLLDDVQELCGNKEGTASILFPVLNYLHQHNKKLILTSDRPPKELDGIADRLIDRFKWGVVEELPKPDYSLRKEILQAKAQRSGLELSDTIIDMIAKTVTGSVRELEGVVLGILGRAIALNAPLTEGLVADVIERTVAVERKPTINFDMIVEATAEAFSLNPDAIFTKNRTREVADARQVVMYLCGLHTSLSTPAIGRRLNRKHTTVLHGQRAVADRMPHEPELVTAVKKIEAALMR